MSSYCSLEQVKTALQIVEDNVQFNSELIGDIATGSGIVDELLRKDSLVVPSPVPQLVGDAAACFAAWAFCKRRDPGRAAGYWDQGMQLIGVYVDGLSQPYVGRV